MSRFDMRKHFQAVQPMLALSKNIKSGTLEPALIELVLMRVSQINGCAYCLDMHSKDARARGESEQRLYVLAAWREAPFYSDRERAALAWCEALTLLAQTGAPDEVYADVREQFDDEEVVALTLAIVAINSWNRFAVGFHSPVGGYVSPHTRRAQEVTTR